MPGAGITAIGYVPGTFLLKRMAKAGLLTSVFAMLEARPAGAETTPADFRGDPEELKAAAMKLYGTADLASLHPDQLMLLQADVDRNAEMERKQPEEEKNKPNDGDGPRDEDDGSQQPSEVDVLLRLAPPTHR